MTVAPPDAGAILGRTEVDDRPLSSYTCGICDRQLLDADLVMILTRPDAVAHENCPIPPWRLPRRLQPRLELEVAPAPEEQQDDGPLYLAGAGLRMIAAIVAAPACLVAVVDTATRWAVG